MVRRKGLQGGVAVRKSGTNIAVAGRAGAASLRSSAATRRPTAARGQTAASGTAAATALAAAVSRGAGAAAGPSSRLAAADAQDRLRRVLRPRKVRLHPSGCLVLLAAALTADICTTWALKRHSSLWQTSAGAEVILLLRTPACCELSHMCSSPGYTGAARTVHQAADPPRRRGASDCQAQVP